MLTYNSVMGRSGSNVVAKRRFTGVLIDDTWAFFTGNVTAPAELTVALLHCFHSSRIVATPTTHDVTAVRS